MECLCEDPARCEPRERLRLKREPNRRAQNLSFASLCDCERLRKPIMTVRSFNKTNSHWPLVPTELQEIAGFEQLSQAKEPRKPAKEPRKALYFPCLSHVLACHLAPVALILLPIELKKISHQHIDRITVTISFFPMSSGCGCLTSTQQGKKCYQLVRACTMSGRGMSRSVGGCLADVRCGTSQWKHGPRGLCQKFRGTLSSRGRLILQWISANPSELQISACSSNLFWSLSLVIVCSYFHIDYCWAVTKLVQFFI